MNNSQRHFENSEKLNEYIADISPTVLLSFSIGKDSLASWVQMKRYFEKIIPVFYYGIPDLEFQKIQLDYYERIFGCRIIQMPNPNLYRQLTYLMYQTPKNAEIIHDLGFSTFSYDDVFNCVKVDSRLPIETYTGVGVRASDSLNRRTSIKIHGSQNPKRFQFFPVYDWNIERTIKEIKQTNIKLPIDYKIWGRTFDGFDYRFIKGLKDNFPKDYEKVREFFPLLEMEFLRYENQ